MNRRKSILGILASFPLTMYVQAKLAIKARTEKGFKVNAGEARFGIHYKMKGATSNILDIRISGSDTENDMALFEQTG